MRLHSAFEFRGELLFDDLSNDNGTLIKQLGNVNDETDFTFEYRVKDIDTLINRVKVNL